MNIFNNIVQYIKNKLNSEQYEYECAFKRVCLFLCFNPCMIAFFVLFMSRLNATANHSIHSLAKIIYTSVIYICSIWFNFCLLLFVCFRFCYFSRRRKRQRYTKRQTDRHTVYFSLIECIVCFYSSCSCKLLGLLNSLLPRIMYLIHINICVFTISSIAAG